MLATKRQIAYLQSLTDRAEYIRQRHPSLIPQGLYHRVWDVGMTSERAGLTIQMYRNILDKCNKAMYRK